MTDRFVTLALSEELYNTIEAQAHVKSWSVDEIVLQTLSRTFPPPIEDDLPGPIKAELKAMEHLADDTLWQIAQSTMNPDKVALWDVLLERQRNGGLTPEGKTLLSQLRQEGDALMLRKAQAYLLLKSRGHQIPTLAELHTTKR